MAIEFECPSCSARIRVLDAYAGKHGQCPSCSTRLLVPVVARPDIPSGRSPGGAVSGDPASGSPGTGSASPGTPEASAPGPTSSAVGIDADVTELLKIQAVPTIKVRHRAAQRRPRRALLIGVPVIGFLILMAIIGFSVTSRWPELRGELPATRFQGKSLPRVTIEWSRTGLSEDDQVRLREYLVTTPETLASQVMTCRFIGSAEGLEVQLTAGPDHEWFIVDTKQNKPLALWLRKEQASLNSRRSALLQSALEAYCRDKMAQISGEKIVLDVAAVRDNVGLNACCKALGFVVQGIAGKKLVPCSYEDDQGQLYFCLPKETRSFLISGRSLPDQSKPFAGEYTAVVSAVTAGLPAASEDRAAEPDDAETTAEPGMKSEEELESDPTPEMNSESKVMER